MPDPSTTDQLLAEFSPVVDSALILAILSDFPEPLSTTDEAAARETLSSLAKDAEAADPEWEQVGGSQPARSSTSSPLEQASVSELSSALEASSLASGDGGRVRSQEENEADEDVNLSGGKRSAGQAFWEKSGASLTSEEDNAVAAEAGGAGKLVWELPDDFVHEAGGLADGDYASHDFFDVGDDPLAFLASVFPDMDLAVLEKKLEGTPFADGTPAPPLDLEALVEELLSEELLTSIAADDAKSVALAEKLAGEGANKQDRQDKRRVKHAQKASNSFSLTSTPHLPSPASSAAASSSDLSTPALFTASATSNAWASISSHASYLSTVMHIPASRITSTYYAQGSSLPSTLAVLLSQLAHDRPFSSLSSGPELRDSLQALIPTEQLSSVSAAARQDELEALLCATEGDVSDALDLHAFVADVQRSMGKNLAWSMLVARDAPAASSAAASGSGDAFTTISGSRRKSPASASSALPSSLPSSASRTPSYTPQPRVYSADDCRRLALEALEKRNAAFREAARAFQRGHGRGVGERGGATVWAEKGRMYEQERRRWEEEAARRTVGERRAITGRDVVDLHGLTLSQALTVVDEACNSWWSASRETLSPPPLRIITGVGRHSRNQRAVLAPAVTRHLDKEGWRWRWDDGPLVAGGMPIRHTGDGAGRGAVKVIGVK
ncbi:hypothetical protein JCM10213_008346 [Rhodosporidiobolus nylandii]